MHSSLSITDGVYAVFTENEISERIAKLGERKPGSNEEIIQQLENLILMLKK